MVELKDDIISIAHQLSEIHAHIKSIKKNHGIKLWGVDDFLVKDVFVLAKLFGLDPEISDIEASYRQTKIARITIEGIAFSSVYTDEEFEECYKKYTEVENNV